jgi:hypothetical protein
MNVFACRQFVQSKTTTEMLEKWDKELADVQQRLQAA